MLDQDSIDGARGTNLFTLASVGLKRFPQSALFEMGKFAQRGLAVGGPLEHRPLGVHVAWINIDGAILDNWGHEPADAPGSMLRPDAIARTYRHLIEQDPNAWSKEIAIRPGV